MSPVVASWLREEGYDVFSVFEEARGAADEELIRRARRENRVLVTSDKDFGEKVFREGKAHGGIVLLRLQDQRWVNQQRVIRTLLQNEEPLAGRFLVVGDDGKARSARDRDGSRPSRG